MVELLRQLNQPRVNFVNFFFLIVSFDAEFCRILLFKALPESLFKHLLDALLLLEVDLFVPELSLLLLELLRFVPDFQMQIPVGLVQHFQVLAGVFEVGVFLFKFVQIMVLLLVFFIHMNDCFVDVV